jgi:hypothetical protein
VALVAIERAVHVRVAGGHRSRALRLRGSRCRERDRRGGEDAENKLCS